MVSGISIILFIILILAQSVKSNKKNLFLILILLAFIPILFAYGYLPNGQGENVKPLLAGSIMSLFLIGPLIYDYTYTFYNPEQVHSISFAKYWAAASAFIISCINYFLLSYEQSVFVIIFLGFCSLLNLVYYLKKNYSLQIKEHQKLKLFYARLNDKDLFWINIPLLGLCVFLLLDTILAFVFSISNVSSIYTINSIYLNGLIWFIAYFGLTQQKIKIENFKEEIEVNELNEEQYSPCQNKEFRFLKERLIILFEQELIYENEKLNLRILAEKLDTSDKKASFLLNKCVGKNFYDFVNHYRIQAFIEKTKSGALQERTILALALESGFNSKATFNRIFKEKMGLTPNQYIKNG